MDQQFHDLLERLGAAAPEPEQHSGQGAKMPRDE
jgi:hypothetical protein